MSLGPIQIGPAEVVVAVLLGLIVSVVLVTVLIVLLWGVALLVVAPTMSAVTTRIGRRRQHNWLRDQWLSVPEEPETTEHARPERPPVCGVSVVCDQDSDTHIDFLAAQVRPTAPAPAPDSTTVVHAVVRAASRLDLLPHPDGQVAVLVLAGHGTAGAERRPVRAGQLAVFGPGAQITVAAASSAAESSVAESSVAQTATGDPRPLEILVLGDAETEHTAGRGEVVVVERSAGLQRRLATLRSLADDALRPVVADAEDAAADRVDDGLDDEAPVDAPPTDTADDETPKPDGAPDDAPATTDPVRNDAA